MKKSMITIIIISIAFMLMGCANKDVACIDWVDFIKLNDIEYIRNYSNQDASDSLIGNKIGEVNFQVAGNVKNPSYRSKNGDAAILKPGTELYKVRNYNENFRIAARVDNKYYIYEVRENPKGKKLKDILDIQNKVIYIGINSEADAKTELGAIKDENKVKSLVDMVLNADVKNENLNLDGEKYFIDFHLKDGTNVIEPFWIKTNEFYHGIAVPKEFAEEIKNSIGN